MQQTLFDYNPITVVFTGPAATRDGTPVLRAGLKAFAERRGYKMQTAVTKDTMLLIASRADTVKARKATERGIEVMTYAAFIDKLGGVIPSTGALPDPYTDTVKTSVPALADGEDYL